MPRCKPEEHDRCWDQLTVVVHKKQCRSMQLLYLIICSHRFEERCHRRNPQKFIEGAGRTLPKT